MSLRDNTSHDSSTADDTTRAVANDGRRKSATPEADDDHAADNFIFLFPLSLLLLLASFAALIAWS
jgi:hypothetical protein